MKFLLDLLLLGCLGMILTALGLFVFTLWAKSQIETGGQIQSSSGDSEVMTFNYNFLKGETQESKDSKIQEAFQKIQDRRDENHAKWLETKAKAIEENEKKEPEDLKLRSVTEGKSS